MDMLQKNLKLAKEIEREWGWEWLKNKRFTKKEDEMLRRVYSTAPGIRGLNLKKLAERLGRHHTNVCRRARHLGLTNPRRKPL